MITARRIFCILCLFYDLEFLQAFQGNKKWTFKNIYSQVVTFSEPNMRNISSSQNTFLTNKVKTLQPDSLMQINEQNCLKYDDKQTSKNSIFSSFISSHRKKRHLRLSFQMNNNIKDSLLQNIYARFTTSNKELSLSKKIPLNSYQKHLYLLQKNIIQNSKFIDQMHPDAAHVRRKIRANSQSLTSLPITNKVDLYNILKDKKAPENKIFEVEDLPSNHISERWMSYKEGKTSNPTDNRILDAYGEDWTENESKRNEIDLNVKLGAVLGKFFDSKDRNMKISDGSFLVCSHPCEERDLNGDCLMNLACQKELSEFGFTPLDFS